MPPNHPTPSPKAPPLLPVWTPDALRLPLERPRRDRRREGDEPGRDDGSDRARRAPEGRERGGGGVVVIDMNDYTVLTWT